MEFGIKRFLSISLFQIQLDPGSPRAVAPPSLLDLKTPSLAAQGHYSQFVCFFTNSLRFDKAVYTSSPLAVAVNGIICEFR